MKATRSGNFLTQGLNRTIVTALLAVLLMSCRSYKGSNIIVSPRPADSEYTGPAPSDDPANPAGNGNLEPGQLKLNVPTDSSDLSSYSFEVLSGPSITFYAWKLSDDEPCNRVRDGYKIEGIKNPLVIDLGNLQRADLSLCVIAFDSKSKQWQSTSKPDVFTWQKVPFRRKVKSYYPFGACEENPEIQIYAEMFIEFDGLNAKSSWIVDPKAWGCDDDFEPFTGTDSLTVKSSNLNEVSGFYTEVDSDFGGWFKFEWLDKDRTKFKGSFGNGDIGQNPLGEWNTELP